MTLMASGNSSSGLYAPVDSMLSMRGKIKVVSASSEVIGDETLTNEMVSYSAQPNLIREFLMPQHLPAHCIQPRVRHDHARVFARAFVMHEVNDTRWETLLEFDGVLCRNFVDDFDMREQTVRGGC
jgi:hypothetical protein